MTGVALSNLRAHPLRLVATALSVVLGIAFVVASFIVTDTVSAAFDKALGDIGADVDIVVRPVGAAGESLHRGQVGVSEQVTDAVAAVDGVAAVAPVYAFPTLLVDAHGEPLRGHQPGSGFGGPPSGANWIGPDALRDQVLRTGRPPGGGDEVAIGEVAAAAQGLARGDAVQVVFPNAVVDATVVGTFGYGDEDTDNGSVAPIGAPSVAVDSSLAAEQLGAPEALRVLAEDGVDPEALPAAITWALDSLAGGGDRSQPVGYEAVGGAAAAQQARAEAGQFQLFLTAALLGFAGVSLLVAGAVIFTTFTITVAQRTRQYALLRAIGAGRGQITAAVLVEALAVGLVGSGAGLVIGFGLAFGLRAVLDMSGLALPIGDAALVLRARTVVVAVILGAVVTVLAALVPAIRANRVPPVQALREPTALKTAARSGAGRGPLVGALVGVAAVISLVAGLFAGDGAESGAGAGLPLTAVGALGVLLAMALFAPRFTAPVARAVGAPVAALRGMPGQLARENAARNPTRTASTAAALMIGLGLASFMLIMAASLQTSIEQDLEEQFFADVQIDPANFTSFPQGAAEALADVDGVAAVSAVKVARVGVAGQPQTVAAVQPESLLDMTAVDTLEGDLAALTQDTAADPTTTREPDTARIALAAALAAHLGVDIGERLPVSLPGTGATARVQARVVAIYDPASLPLGQGVQILLPYDLLAAAAQQGDTAAYVTLAEGVTIEEARPALESALSDFPTAQLLDYDEARARVRAGGSQALSLVLGLLLLSIVIALFGITNTLGLSVTERTRELGLLRAVGMTRTQTKTMIRWEAVIVALLGALLGTAMSVFLGWLAVRALPGEVNAYAVPVSQLTMAVVVAGGAGVLAAVIPARRASRVDVLRAITLE